MKPTDIDKQDALEEQARSFKDDEVPAGAQYERRAAGSGARFPAASGLPRQICLQVAQVDRGH